MKKAQKFLLIIAAIFFVSPATFAQLDVEHYIPPMFGREDEGTHYIVLSTPSTTPFDVTITDGSGTVITTQNISNLSSSSYLLGSGTATEFLVQESELNTVMANEGLILTGNFPFYVNLRVIAGPQAGSLTSKGSKASFGQDFRTGHLFNNLGEDYRKANVIGVMATEDNTTVNINDISAGVVFKNAPQTGGTSDPMTIVLDAGESYVIAAYLDEPGATNNTNGVNGTHIISDKDIVVNTGSWLGGNALESGVPSTGRDLGIDQIVPLDLVGDEYVVIKGEGIDNEKVIVVATADNTELFLNGSAVPTTTINAGEYYVYDVNDFTANENMYIETSNPVYVYQTENSGDGFSDDNERQCGLNFLPPIGCSGSKSVLLPDVDFIGTAQINIIANAGASVIVDGVPLGAGDVVTGTADYVTYKLANSYTGDILITSDDLTRVSLVNLSGNIGAAGYFSGFTKDVTVQTQTVNADNIALEGCIPASFNFSIDAPSTDDTEITYQVVGTATNGVDYDFIDTVLIIPAGQTSGTVFINSIADAIPEGQETVYIIFQPDACSPVDTAVLYIDDAQPIEFTLDGTDLGCFENSTGEILVSATGGFPAYTYHVTDDGGNGTTTQYTTNPITGLPAGTYSVQVYDIYGCKAEALIIGGVYDADTTFLPDGTGVFYESIIPISGFNGTQTLDNMTQLQQVCATMEHSYLGDLQIKVISPSGQEVILKQFNGGGSCDLGEPFASAPVDGQNSNLTDPGVGFEYCWNATPNYGTMVAESNNFTHTIPASIGGTYTDNYLPAGAYTSFENLDGLLGSTLNGDWKLEVGDQFNLDNGYIFSWNISLVSDLPDTIVTIEEPLEIDVNGFITEAQCGGLDGAIDVSIIGDFPPYTFLWSSGQTTEDISGIGAGTYTVYVTDDNGCMDSATFNLNNISSMNTVISVTDVVCSGSSNGAIDVTTSGGTTPYDFSWSSGPTTEDLASITEGIYTLTITDDNGCILTEDVTVNSTPPISITLNNATNEVCSQVNGAIDVNVSGGSGSYGYSWDNAATTEDLVNIGVGTYFITVTDGNGCTALESFSIINDVSNCSQFCYLNVVSESITNEICGDGTGAIDITVMDAASPYILSWNTGATTDDISSLGAGTYTVTILDANQCELIEGITVLNESGSLSIASYAVANENCGNADGAIDISVVGGTAPYTFSWSNAEITEDVNSLVAGTYDVTITDDLGCEITESFTVSNNTGTLSESAVVSNETCGNGAGSINLTVSGGVAPYTYVWNSGPTTQDISSLSAGSFNVTITDDVGCILNSANYTITNLPGDLTLLSLNITNENCLDGTGAIDIEIINGDPPYSYAWSNAAITQDITGLSAGIYSCTVTDNLGCEVLTGDQNVFNQGGSLSATTNAIVDEVCGDGTGSIDINTVGGTSPYTYSWDNGGSTEDISGLSAGAYILTITDDNGCVLDYVENVQNLSPGFTVAITSTTDEVCGDGSGAIDIATSGGAAPISFIWSNGDITEDLSGINAGNYSVVITDNNGCEINTSASISGAGIVMNAVNISDEICGDLSGGIDIDFVGGLNPYTFAWSNGSSTEDISNLAAGDYNLTITGSNGCAFNDIYTVNNNTNGLTIVSTIVTDENCGDGAGAIDVTISGGANPISFDWDNGSTTEDLTGLSAGNYNLIVEDVNGCALNTAATVINNSAGFAASINTITDENCGDGTGAVNIDVTGGQAPYVFSWDNGPSTEDISGLNAGDYEVTVTDDNGCAIVLSATVLNNTGGFAISNAVIGDASCASPNGFIDLTVTGGATPYGFAWSNLETTEDIAGLSSGTYDCIITDNAGCVINYSGTVSITGGALTTSVAITDENCGNANGEIIVNMTGGISPYTYSWTGGTPSTCCDYTLDMQDTGNSWSGATLTVLLDGTSIGDFQVFNGGANIETFTACDGQSIELIWNPGNWDNEVSFDLIDPLGTTIFSQGPNPTPGSLYTTTASCPSGPNSQTSISGLSAGTYDLTIIDDVGCQITESYTVTNLPSDVQINVTSTTDETCAQNNGEIVYNITGGTAPYATTANGFNDGPPVGILSNLYADDWEIITTDDNGCTDTLIVQIVNTATFTTAVSVTDETCGAGDGAIDLTITGGTNMLYDWDNGATTEDLSGLVAGTYECTITDDDNGCEDVITVDVVNLVDLTITDVITDENCGDNTGAIDLTITGSTDIAIAWSNGASTEDITGLNAGSYTVSVLNNTTGCLTEMTYTVSNVTSGMTVTSNITDEDCGNADGEIDLTVTGGVGPYSYVWSNGATTEDITGLVPGTYTVTLTDDNDGCQHVESFDVISDGNFNLNLISVTNENCSDGTGEIDIDISGPGTFNVDVLWSNGETTEDITNLSAGLYTVSATNFFGCEMQMDVTVSNDGDLTVLSTFTNENCGDGTGSIDLSVTGSTDLSFDWDNGATTEDLSGLFAGTYICTITNNTSGCTEQVTVEVLNISTGVAITGSLLTDDFCGNGNGGIDITVGGGVGPYSFLWSNGATTEDLNGVISGPYTVTVTDDNDGCSISQSFDVVSSGSFSVSGVVTNSSCSTCTTGGIDVTINESFPDGPYSFSWSNGETTEDISNLAPGTYTITVTSNSGCTVVTDFVVGDNDDVGVDDLHEGWKVSVYPNPTRIDFTVSYNFYNDKNVIMTLKNVIGETVITKLLTDSEGKVVLSVEDLRAGVYIIHLANETRTDVIKIIVSK